MPTLAELRARRPVHRSERAFTICLRPDLVAEMQSLSDQLQSLVLTGEDGPPSRMGGEPSDSRADEIEARLHELAQIMAEDEGELRIASDEGKWLQWVKEHPARQKTDDPAGYARDIEISRFVTGYAPDGSPILTPRCNADDLIDDLGIWASSWEGEPLTDTDWAVLAASIGRPDKKRIAQGVVAIHEQTDFDLGKWRAGLSVTLRKSPADASPALSADPPQSSLAESPQNDTSTTTPTTT